MLLAFLASSSHAEPEKRPRHVPACQPGDFKTPEKPASENRLCGKGSEWKEADRLCRCKSGFEESGQDVLGRLECKAHEKQPDFTGYIARLQRSIRAAWKAPSYYEPTPKLKETLMFKVRRDGSLGNVCMQDSSADQAFNDAGYRAILKAAPFGPLPADYKGTDIDVQFIFDYEQLMPRPSHFQLKPSTGFGVGGFH